MRKVQGIAFCIVVLLFILTIGYSISIDVEARAELKEEVALNVEVIYIETETEIVPTVSSQPEPEPKLDLEELDLLAHLIFAEAGSDWCEDEMQLYAGSVALNRVKHAEYPDTLYDVIYQEGQYSCVDNGMIEYEYNDRAYECAKFLLLSGSQLPENVVFQAPFEQGDGTYKQVQNMYFCYIEEGE